jgi:Fur family peroxide stress response transcriptional regulator
MDQQGREARLQELARTCRKQGVPCTPQRRIILEAVLARDDHPTADQVFRDVQERHLGVSRATVHRTLEMLVGMGLITKACHPGKSNRYDPRTEIHHHLVCLRCDRIIDLQDAQLDAVPLPDTSTLGFKLIDHRVQLRGICAECRREED